MKKIVSLFSVILLIVFLVMGVLFLKSKKDIKIYADGIENQDNVYEASTYITDEMKNNAEGLGAISELNRPYTPEFMLENSNVVALVTVISLDGFTFDYNSFGATYGKLLINNVLYGDASLGQVVDYIKPGGVVSVAEFDKNDAPAAVRKRDYLYSQAGIEIDKENSYIDLRIADDIEIEAGKTYLAYLNYVDGINKYEIIGEGNGLREVSVEQKARITENDYDMQTLKLKNNKTDKWESLTEYIENNIKQN